MTQPARFSDDQTATLYERLLLPRVFRPWAELLLGRVGLRPGDKVLDVATGPGTLARLAAEQVGPTGEVHGGDLSEPMLAQAKAKPPVMGGAPLAYVQSSADTLPFADATFDVVCCQQGLQFFPDQPKALAEMRRVLKPGGRLGLACWAGQSGMTMMAAFHAALDAVRGHASELPPIRWVDVEGLRAMLRGAHFHEVRTELASYTVHFDDLEQVVACVHGTSAGMELRALRPEAQERFRVLTTDALRPYVHAAGVRIPSQAVLGLAQS
jgi:SAM-dependent methyltransferase